MVGGQTYKSEAVDCDSEQPDFRDKDASKRVFDLVIIVGLFPLIASVFLLVSVSVAIEQIVRRERGPLLLTEPRISKGREFRLYKLNMFREPARRKYTQTSANFYELQTYRYLQECPQSLLLVGRLMKKFYLDEVGQAINVLLGHMSMVGPRPRAVGEPISFEAPRRMLKSGIFCFVANRWKTGGMTWLSYSSDEDYLALYCRSSVLGVLWLDLRILLDGLRTIAKGKGL